MKQLVSTKPFEKRLKALVNANWLLERHIDEAFHRLSINPFDPSLMTHKAETRRYGLRYSSRVTGDLRIIWDFDAEDRVRLLLLDLGGHSGKHSVY